MSNACNTRCYTITTYITYTPSCYKSILQFHLYWNCQVHEIYSRVSGSMFPYYRNSRSIIVIVKASIYKCNSLREKE